MSSEAVVIGALMVNILFFRRGRNVNKDGR